MVFFLGKKMQKKLFFLSMLLISSSGYASQAPSSVAILNNDVFGSAFNQGFNQDQADINRTAVGGTFLPDYFEPALQVQRATYSLNSKINGFIDRNIGAYFDVDGSTNTFLQSIADVDLPIPLEDLLLKMRLYMDRTITKAERDTVVSEIYTLLSQTAEVTVDITTQVGVNPPETLATPITVNMFESIFGRDEVVTVDGDETTTVAAIEGSLVTLLKQIDTAISPTIAIGDITWKQNEGVDVATKTIKDGVIFELLNLKETNSALISLVQRVDMNRVIGLFDGTGNLVNVDESLNDAINKHNEESNDILMARLTQIDEVLGYITPMIKRIYNYTI